MAAQDERSGPGTRTPGARALSGIRVIELADEQAEYCGLTLAGLGADVIKVELKSHPDTRLAAMAPVGGRAARDQATAPLPGVTDLNMGGPRVAPGLHSGSDVPRADER